MCNLPLGIETQPCPPKQGRFPFGFLGGVIDNMSKQYALSVLKTQQCSNGTETNGLILMQWSSTNLAGLSIELWRKCILPLSLFENQPGPAIFAHTGPARSHAALSLASKLACGELGSFFVRRLFVSFMGP